MLYKTIHAKELKKAIEKDSDALVLDVRTPMEFNRGHIEGAMNISHDEVPARVSELLQYKDKKIFVICMTANRSAFVCDVLSRMGFSQLYNVIGGYLDLE